ncbi:uncharacterized protein L203_104429 [Cryptococcus depauperatus CBS 7841]|uniref:MARVEL domain-containing protein n=1 Tax=Cryptococcus depauperatus CBS 7841 TaxID=1295531 RepID=A0AAJ8JVF8_9TREE
MTVGAHPAWPSHFVLIVAAVCSNRRLYHGVSRWVDGLSPELTGHDTYPSHSYRDRLKFLVFTSWWTVFFTAGYLAAFVVAFSSLIASIASHVAFLTITWLFWLAAAASYTAALGGQRCSGSTLSYCSHHLAAEAFAWIEWILMTIALVFILLIAGGAIRRGDRLSAELA